MIPNRILVPIDFSPCSEAALELAVSLAKRLDARIDVLHVWQTPDYVSPEMMVSIPGEDPVTFATIAERQARRRTERVAALIRERDGVGVGQYVEFGDPYATILRTAETGYDLIVLGTHGRSGLPRMFLGSLAEKIVRGAPCPVLTVRKTETPAAAVEEAEKLSAGRYGHA